MESILPIQLEVIWTRYLLILRVVVKRVRVNLSDRWNLVLGRLNWTNREYTRTYT